MRLYDARHGTIEFEDLVFSARYATGGANAEYLGILEQERNDEAKDIKAKNDDASNSMHLG